MIGVTGKLRGSNYKQAEDDGSVFPNTEGHAVIVIYLQRTDTKARTPQNYNLQVG